MKTINDSHKIQCLEETICNHKKAIAQQTLAKQQLVDFYIKSAHAIATQLKNLLSINDGYEFSLLFNLPKADNREILKSWVIDYLINNNVETFSSPLLQLKNQENALIDYHIF